MMEGFGGITAEIWDDRVRVVSEGTVETMVGGELCSQDYLVAVVSRSEPLSQPDFRLFILVMVCSVDKVTTQVVVLVEDAECGFFVAFPHQMFPHFQKVISILTSLRLTVIYFVDQHTRLCQSLLYPKRAGSLELKQMG
jgi:hypothetical protein